MKWMIDNYLPLNDNSNAKKWVKKLGTVFKIKKYLVIRISKKERVISTVGILISLGKVLITHIRKQEWIALENKEVQYIDFYRNPKEYTNYESTTRQIIRFHHTRHRTMGQCI